MVGRGDIYFWPVWPVVELYLVAGWLADGDCSTPYSEWRDEQTTLRMASQQRTNRDVCIAWAQANSLRGRFAQHHRCVCVCATIYYRVSLLIKQTNCHYHRDRCTIDGWTIPPDDAGGMAGKPNGKCPPCPFDLCYGKVVVVAATMSSSRSSSTMDDVCSAIAMSPIVLVDDEFQLVQKSLRTNTKQGDICSHSIESLLFAFTISPHALTYSERICKRAHNSCWDGHTVVAAQVQMWETTKSNTRRCSRTHERLYNRPGNLQGSFASTQSLALGIIGQRSLECSCLDMEEKNGSKSNTVI